MAPSTPAIAPKARDYQLNYIDASVGASPRKDDVGPPLRKLGATVAGSSQVRVYHMMDSELEYFEHS
ncbi:hypothetical protein PMZ80_008475 [Knufia obscura]|uniref:Uncharacterized protein n=2 Tax=Knufia TaxID=430999 RepID=A0AAN8EQP3_9EURO|nr:hypothetical protein PMZ80_008475 [Knufia obscura]KAK5951931.1 hypothetical protein OHC33_006817 [Knufia fluminis]